MPDWLLHLTVWNHVADVCKRRIVILKTKPNSAGISFRANKPLSVQLAPYKLGCHKNSIRTSAVYKSPTVITHTVRER